MKRPDSGSVQQLPDPLPRKLNVGCGFDYRDGYLNADLHEMHNPDLVADVTNLPMLPDDAFEEIVAQDVLEHFVRAKTLPALAEWARLLVPEGLLHLRVPSLMGMFELLASPDRRAPEQAAEVIHLMYGTQAYDGDYHLAGFTAATLTDLLQRAGLLVCEASVHDGWLFDVRARKTAQLANNVEFIHSVYFSILGRPVDPVGLDGYTCALESGAITRDAVQAEIRRSEEAQFLERHPSYLRPYMQLFKNA